MPVAGEAHIDDHGFYLRQYFSDQMRPNEYKQQQANLLLMAAIWRTRAMRWARRQDEEVVVPWAHIPRGEDLEGTPLNPCIQLSFDIFQQFKTRTKAEVVNMAYLTDGDSDCKIRYMVPYESTPWMKPEDKDRLRANTAKDSDKYNVVLTHKETRKSVRCHATDHRHTHSLVQLLRDVTGANVVCFDLVASQGRRLLGHKMHRGVPYYKWTPEQTAQADQAWKQFRKQRCYVLDNQGFNEYYLVPGGRDLEMEDEEMDIEAGADKKKLLKAFTQMQNTKQTNRILLNRFIGMIA